MLFTGNQNSSRVQSPESGQPPPLLNPPTPSSSSPPASIQSSSHPGWPESHLKLWNCIPFSSPINSGAVSKTNGGFRKSILMKEKEKEQGKDTYLREGGGATQGSYEENEGKIQREKERESRRRNVCVFIECVCRIMCVLCNTVSSDKGWGGVHWVDLATVRPISSSVV